MPNHLIPIRLSHLLAQSGVGAIVRGPDELVVVRDTRQWTDRNGQPGGGVIPYVERVRAALGVTEVLREPPVAREGAHGQVDGVCIPVSRFPAWARCPSCGALYLNPWRADGGESPRCDRQACNTARSRRDDCLSPANQALETPYKAAAPVQAASSHSARPGEPGRIAWRRGLDGIGS